MKLALLATVVLGALALAVNVSAKGAFDAIQVCGPQACVKVLDRDVLGEIARLDTRNHRVVQLAPPPRGPYYELRGGKAYPLLIGWFVRGFRAVSWSMTGRWVDVGETVARRIDRVAAGFRPYPRPEPIRGRLYEQPNPWTDATGLAHEAPAGLAAPAVLDDGGRSWWRAAFLAAAALAALAGTWWYRARRAGRAHPRGGVRATGVAARGADGSSAP